MYFLIYLEVAAVAVAAFVLGYFFSPTDPLLLHDGVFLVLLIGVVTLFFGFKGGGFLLALLSLAMVGYYGSLDLLRFLEALIALLLFGAFAKAWHERLDRVNEQLRYERERLRELGNAFYMIKLSHDQLELNYVLKPVSLRKLILHVAHLHHDPQKAFADLVAVLKRHFGIERALLYAPKREIVVGDGELEREDPLLMEVMEKKESRYIALGEDFKRYVAVIYGHVADEEIFFAIEKIPFQHFNEDTFHAIAFVLDFFLYSLHKEELLERNQDFLPQFQPIFRYELLRLHHLQKRYDVVSSVLVFKTSDRLLYQRLKESVERSKRGLDVASEIEERGVVAILAPFTTPKALQILKKRVIDRLDVVGEFKSAIFALDEIEQFQEYIDRA